MAAIGEWAFDHLGTLVFCLLLVSMIRTNKVTPVKLFSTGTLIAFAAVVVEYGFFETYHLVWSAQQRIALGLLVLIPYGILFIRDLLLWKRRREQNIVGWYW